MFDPVLVPLDGSQLAEGVLPHVIAVARAFDAEITLLRMLGIDRAGAAGQLFDLINWKIHKKEAWLYLEKIKARLQELDVRVRTTVLEGLAAEGITEFAQNQGMRLLILSSHGQSGLTRWGISSIAQKIIQSAPASLLIVRARHDRARSGELSEPSLYQRILVPLDGSQRAENVLPIITQLAQCQNSRVHLARIVQTPEMARQMPAAREDTDLADQVVARNRAEAELYLERVKTRSYLEGIAVQTHLLISNNAMAAMYQLEEQEHIDLVVLSAHGYSGSHQWPYGSVADHFITHGRMPLLIVQDLPARLPLAHELLSRERANR